MNLLTVLVLTALLPSAGSSFPTAALAGEKGKDADSAEIDRVERVRPPLSGVDFVISKFDHSVVEQFEKSWNSVQHGNSPIESVVLIVRTLTGYQARSQKLTHEYKKCTFPWHPATIAVIHTHPNNSPSVPQPDDMEIADKYHVPMFTLTDRGMFVYDPSTRKTRKVMDGIDWLDPRKWDLREGLNQ